MLKDAELTKKNAENQIIELNKQSAIRNLKDNINQYYSNKKRVYIISILETKDRQKKHKTQDLKVKIKLKKLILI